jgi:hypothetical protein
MNLMISKIPLRHRSAAIAAMQADVAVDILSYVIGESALAGCWSLAVSMASAPF